jgi:hypothetical protein
MSNFKSNSNANTGAKDRTNMIAELQPFFLTKQMFVKKSQQIKPIQKDTLFWCHYILKHGQSSYEQQFKCGGISYVKEKQLKIALVEELRGDVVRSRLKLCKLTSIDHVEDQLANENVIDLATFFSLCFIDNIQVFYFKDKCYYQTLREVLPWAPTAPSGTLGSRAENDEGVVDFDTIYDAEGTGYDEDDYDFSAVWCLRQTHGRFWIEEVNVLDIDWARCYHIENVNKPLRAISAYTAPQLKELAGRFGLNIAGKKKQEVYDMVKSFVKIDLI